MDLESKLDNFDKDLLKLSNIFEVGSPKRMNPNLILEMKKGGEGFYNSWSKGRLEELYDISLEYKSHGKIMLGIGLAVLPTGYGAFCLPMFFLGTFQLIYHYRAKKIFNNYLK